jgi:hypothetical protein
MRRHADRDPLVAQALELAQVARDRLLAEARRPAAPVRGEEQDDLDPGLACGLRRSAGFLEAQVVELADRGVAGRAQLLVDGDVLAPDRLGCRGRSASAIITSRQAQKSPPSARPRKARWNPCECASTKPGSVSVTGADATGLREGGRRSRGRAARSTYEFVYWIWYCVYPLPVTCTK